MSPAGMKWIVHNALVCVTALLLLTGGRAALAQGSQPRSRDAGGPPEAFFEAMKAYREGMFYLNHGAYKHAIERLAVAVERIPAPVMAVVPAYQDMHWVLGEAQEAAGLREDALVSYQRWLILAGDNAAPWTVVKVHGLAVQSGAGRAALANSTVISYLLLLSSGAPTAGAVPRSLGEGARPSPEETSWLPWDLEPGSQLRLRPPPDLAGDAANLASLLFELVSNNGQAAVEALALLAFERGGWTPAPGDFVIYDPGLASSVQGLVRVVDLRPSECDEPMFRRHMGGQCDIDLTAQQREVRFGYTTFVDVLENGDSSPRRNLDDLLSVYIEEVGHSWQEYLYETEGRGFGPRTRLTPWEVATFWSTGWEYQVKRYVLSLDGSWLTLSDGERNALRTSICAADGYANPIGKHVAPYGPPPNWPNPEGWSLSAPTAEEHADFCATV